MKHTYLLLILFFCSKIGFSQNLYFPPINGSIWDTLSPQELNWCPNKIDSLYTYLNDNNTKAFILLKDGKIVLEKYFGTHTANSVWQWASAGKTITSFMVGIAQQENYLSISDTSATYLGQGWTSCTQAQEQKITIKDQLSMTSGLDEAAGDPFCTDDTCLIYKADAGSRWAYHNGPYTLLDGVIENATGSTLNAYTTAKLKNPTGISGAFVSVDYNNVYFSTARSMARFGLLILNEGTWDGNPIMTDNNYFQEMVNTSQTLNESYGYLWWLNGKASYLLPGSQFAFSGSLSPNAPDDMFAAMGKDGQFINVVPSQNLVWIRMGEAPDNLPVPYLMNDEIWKYLNELNCTTTSINVLKETQNVVQLYPNPSKDKLQIKANSLIESFQIINTQGQVVLAQEVNSNEINIALFNIKTGLYFVRTKLENGTVALNKILINN